MALLCGESIHLWVVDISPTTCYIYLAFHECKIKNFISIIQKIYVPLHPKASRAVIFGWTRQPSFGNHGGQYDAEVMTSRTQYQTRLNIAEARIKLDESQVTLFTSKTFQVMQQHIYYIRYALRFADMQISELVSIFNAQVQSRGWSSMRAYHDQALLSLHNSLPKDCF